MATKPPSAAQLAARKKFSEMARNGSLNRKRQIAAKQSKYQVKPVFGDNDKRYGWGVFPTKGSGDTWDVWPTKAQAVEAMNKQLSTEGRKSNPAKKTVSQKISQLVNEGYPQKQAVAVALNEQRAGKVKRNPSKTMKRKKISYESSLNRGVLKSYVVRDMEKNNDIAEFMSKSEAMKYARDYSDRNDVQVSVRSV